MGGRAWGGKGWNFDENCEFLPQTQVAGETRKSRHIFFPEPWSDIPDHTLITIPDITGHYWTVSDTISGQYRTALLITPGSGDTDQTRHRTTSRTLPDTNRTGSCASLSSLCPVEMTGHAGHDRTRPDTTGHDRTRLDITGRELCT